MDDTNTNNINGGDNKNTNSDNQNNNSDSSASLPQWIIVDPLEGSVSSAPRRNINSDNNTNNTHSQLFQNKNVVKFNFSLNLSRRTYNFWKLYQSAQSFKKLHKVDTQVNTKLLSLFFSTTITMTVSISHIYIHNYSWK